MNIGLFFTMVLISTITFPAPNFSTSLHRKIQSSFGRKGSKVTLNKYFTKKREIALPGIEAKPGQSLGSFEPRLAPASPVITGQWFSFQIIEF